jgi:MFS family permease
METTAIRKIVTRDFIFGFLAQLTFTVAHHMFIPTLPIYLSRSGSKETEIGILIGVFTISALALRPFIGNALSRIPEKKFMIVGALLYGATALSFIMAPPFWPFFAVRIFQGIGYAFFYTGSFTLIANISPEGHRGQSVGYFLLALNVALAIGPSLGMFLINHVSYPVFFTICSGLAIGSLFISRQLRGHVVSPAGPPPSKGGSFLSREALPSSIISFFFFFIWGAFTTFFPLYAIENGVANPGHLFTAIAVTLIASRLLAGRIVDVYRSETLLLPCFFIFVLAMVLIAVSRTLPLFILAGVVWGIGHAFFYPALVVYILDRVGTSRGLAMSTLTGFSDLGTCLGAISMGIVIHLTSYPLMFVCLALVGFVNLNYFQFYVRKKRPPVAATG